MKMKLWSAVVIALVPVMVEAQQDKPVEATQAPPGHVEVLPAPDFRYQGSVGRTIAESDPPQFPQPAKPPKGAPNIVFIMIDDAGYGQFGTFGGQIPTPALDRVAADGLRYTRFHTTALCSPTGRRS